MRPGRPSLREAPDAQARGECHGAGIFFRVQRRIRRGRAGERPFGRRQAFRLNKESANISGLEDLYREIILDHYRSPRNRGELPTPPAHVETGFNPLCGDEITLYLLMDGDRLVDIKLAGQGCSISQSSASMMSTAVKGHTVSEIKDTVRRFKSMMSVHEAKLDGADGADTDGADSEGGAPETPLGDLEALQGVVKFPVRIKCATLSWNTLSQALEAAAAS